MNLYPYLISPIQVGALELKNRMVMAPMSNHMTHDGSLTDQEIAYNRRRAAGGAAMLTIGSLLIKQDGDFGGQIYIDHDDRIPRLKELVDAVHAEGALISGQIHHSGRETNARTSGFQPVAPSVIEPESISVFKAEYDIPRELSTEEVGAYVEHYAQAIRRAREAGFDAVELHAAHGYLISAFMSPMTNLRTDKYGGSFLARMRFVTEIMERARKLVGTDFTITARISGDELRQDGIDMALSAKIAQYLEGLGISALSVSAQMYPFVRTCPNMYFKPGVNVYLAQNVKEAVSIPVMTAGRINTPELAEEILAKGRADLIGLGRILIADPDFPNKAKFGQAEDIIPCIACNKGCHDRTSDNRFVKCILNTMTGRELTFQITPAESPKKVMVIGGGPAGMEAARVADLRGHMVSLYDRADKLGGRMILAGMPPHKDGYLRGIEYLNKQLTSSGVKIYLNTVADLGLILEERPDAVILASGSSPIIPPIPGADQSNVTTADEILFETVTAGRRAVVIGGGSVGAETAHYLIENQCVEVYLVEMLDEIAVDMPQDSRIVLLEEFRLMPNLKVLTSTRVEAIKDECVFLSLADGQKRVLEAIDTIVFATGVRSNATLAAELEVANIPVYIVGDAKKPRDVLSATYEGSVAAREV